MLVLLAREGVAPVVSREAHLAASHLARQPPDVLSEVFAGNGRARRRDLARNQSRLVHRGHALVMTLPEVVKVLRLVFKRPLPVGRLIDRLRLQRIFPGVEGNICWILGNAGHRCQFLGNRNFYIRVSGEPA